MFENCIYFNLSTLSKQITKIWNDEFAKLGLSPSHGYILSALADNSDLSQKELSEIMELDASTITRFIDALAKKKLIDKTTIGKGARYTLTDTGNETAVHVKQLMADLFSKMKNIFDENDFKEMIVELQQAKLTLKEAYE